MRLYLDTSAVVKLYVEENGSAAVREMLAAADVVATSSIAYVEARAAFARRWREGHFTAMQHRSLVRSLDTDWDRYLALEVTEPLIREAAELAETHRLRAYDAVHLASACLLKRRIPGGIIFVAWDTELNAAARREGIRAVGEDRE